MSQESKWCLTRKTVRANLSCNLRDEVAGVWTRIIGRFGVYGTSAADRLPADCGEAASSQPTDTLLKSHFILYISLYIFITSHFIVKSDIVSLRK